MTRIFVLGDLILDHTVNVQVQGLSVEAHNSLVVAQQEESYALGGAGNVAAGIRALGREVTVLGLRVQDTGGAMLVNLLGRVPINTLLGYYQGGHTSVKTRYQTSTGQLLRVDQGNNGRVPDAYWDSEEDAPAFLKSALAIGEAPVICLVNYNKGLFDSYAGTHVLMRQLREQVPPLPILVDPGSQGNWSWFSHPNALFKVNLRQAQAHYHNHDAGRPDLLVPMLEPGEVFDPNRLYPRGFLDNRCTRVANNLKVGGVQYRYLVVTFGASGMALISGAPEDDPVLFVNDEAMTVRDTCGAGDTVMATLAAVIAEKGYTREMVRLACYHANVAAGFTVDKVGCYSPRRDEVFPEGL